MTVASETRDVVDPREVTLAALFLGCLQVALSGFGAVLAQARHMIVQDRRWLSERDFTAMLGLCQFLPGGNIVNLSIQIGTRFQGPLGSIAACAGLMLAPAVIPLCASSATQEMAASVAFPVALAAAAVHTGAMLLVTAAMAGVVYEWMDLAALRRADASSDARPAGRRA